MCHKRKPGEPVDYAWTMLLVINGEERQFAESMPVAQLLEALGMKADRVAVEVNREIVPRARWAGTQLCDGDRLEIVHFVGGGNAFAIS